MFRKAKIFCVKGAGKASAIVRGGWRYVRSYAAYRKLVVRASAVATIRTAPKIFDDDPSSHTFDAHYVYMDRWAAGKLLGQRPPEHVDVGSSVNFLSFASLITRVKFVDIRPVSPDFTNFECTTGSVLSMPFRDGAVPSLSCLHVAEHIGLGRYGDPLDPFGTEKACAELARVLAPGGILYFALPIGEPVTYFNAHRVHAPRTILGYFKDLELREFCAVNDAGNFVTNANMDDYAGARYSCGMFLFRKPEDAQP